MWLLVPLVLLIKGQAGLENLRKKQDANGLILMGGEFSRSSTIGVWKFVYKEALVQMSGSLEAKWMNQSDAECRAMASG